MFCKKCGKEIQDNSKVCEFCGERIAFYLKDDLLLKVKEKVMSNKKIAIIGVGCLAAIIALVILITNISNGIGENDIKSYYLENDCLDEDEIIKSIDIVSKEETTDGKLKLSMVMVTEDDECRYIQEGGVICYKTSEGWEIQNTFSEHPSDYEIEPLKGIDEEDIKETLEGFSITIDDEIWSIYESNISDIKIEKQDTNLKDKQDSIMVSIVISDVVQEAKGKLDLKYSFDRKWELDSSSENGSFTVSTKAGKELELTADTLISNIDNKKFVYGLENSTQDFTIKKDELSNFKINDTIVSEKGSKIEYKCSGNITKSFATFTLDTTITYTYTDNWEYQSFSASAKCDKVNIQGTLKGTNLYGWPCKLVLSSSDEQGNMSGAYYYEGNSANKGHSYYVSGSLDLERFTFKLEPGEIISKPFSFYKADVLQGYIKIDDGIFMFNDSGTIKLTLN